MIHENGFSTVCALLGLEALNFVVHVDFAVCLTPGQKTRGVVELVIE